MCVPRLTIAVGTAVDDSRRWANKKKTRSQSTTLSPWIKVVHELTLTILFLRVRVATVPKQTAGWKRGVKRSEFVSFITRRYKMFDFTKAIPRTDGVGTSNAATAVDARVKGGMMTVCEFAGDEFDPDKRRRCKHYNKSQYRACCHWFYEDIEVGHCGYAGP
jgi:hypothetical protein